MRRHRFLVWGVVLLLVASGLVAVLLWPRSDGPVSRARCERIQVGMTEAEVNVLLDGPPGDYTAGVLELDSRRQVGDISVLDFSEQFEGKQRYRAVCWWGDEGMLWVVFDEDDRVAVTQFTPGYRSDTPAGTLRHWLGF